MKNPFEIPEKYVPPFLLALWNFHALGGLGDRYAFPFIFGSGLLLVVRLGLAEKSKTRYKIAVLLVGNSVSFHA